MVAITSAILCDFAQVREGLLFVSSGGITRIRREKMPAPVGVVLALMTEIPAGELGKVHELVVSIKHVDTAREIARLTGAAKPRWPQTAFPGENLHVPLALDLRGVGVPDFGAYDVATSMDSVPGPRLTFYVVDAHQQSPAQD